jgi:adenylate cyclase
VFSRRKLAWRFVRRLAFSLLQASIFGSLLGVMVYYRLPQGTREEGGEEELAWHQRIRVGLERLELPFYDLRMRALADRANRSDDVVVVAVDAETLSNAREAEASAYGVQPWPRDLVGALTERMLEEGAASVLLNWQMPDASPVGFRVSTRGPLEPLDDVAFRVRLDRHPDESTLGMGWSRERGALPVTGLYPFLLHAGKAPSAEAVRHDVRKILAFRRPAFVIPDKSGVDVWAGVSSDEDGAKFAETLGVKPPLRIREYAASERAHQMTSVELAVTLARVEVRGLDPLKLIKARTLEPPFPALMGQNSALGVMELRSDSDGVVRTVPLFIAYEPKEGQMEILPSVLVRTAMQLGKTKDLRYEKGILHIGEHYSLPMDESGQMLIRWDSSEVGREARGGVKRSIPAWRFIVNQLDAQADRPAHYDNDLDKRAVVFTRTEGDGARSRNTSVGRRVPDGAIHAQALANILGSSGIRRVLPKWDLIATFSLAFLGAFLALSFSGSFRSSWGAVLYFSSVAAAGVGYWLFARSLFLEDFLWISVVSPLMAMTAAFFSTTGYVFRTEAQLRDFVYGTLGRYVSPELARRVRRDLSLMAPERRRVTVCACDLEGFTYRTRDLAPEKLAAFLGAYVETVGEVVRRTGGLMDRSGGDQIVAFWGAPVPNPHHARDACAAVVDIQRAVAKKADIWRKDFGLDVRLRIAVETGEAVVGEIGSALQSSYSIVGGVVSLATGLTKSNALYGTHALVSEETAAQAGGAFAFREADRLLLRADKKATVVYELLGRTNDLQDGHKSLLRDFTSAIEAYHSRKFDIAKELFETCAQQHNDALSKLYGSRSEHYLQRPPPPEWDQVYEQRVFPGV